MQGKALRACARLGREWLKRCAKMVPDRADEISDIAEDAAERAKQGSDACSREGGELLGARKCNSAEDCTKQAQRWISRCGSSYATPLLVMMLTRAIERRQKEPIAVELDNRSCDELGKRITGAVGCANEEGCKEGAEATAIWTERCGGGPVAPTLAFAMADVMVGGSQSVDPIPVGPDDGKLDGSLPLVVDDGQGTAVWVCGERPRSLPDYLTVRSKCAPGEVIFARIDASRYVRTFSVPHGSDAEFQRLFPFLVLRGEREARDAAGLAAFRRGVSQAVESARARQGPAAAAQLAGALIPNAAALVRSEAYRKALAQADPFLGPAMREWARRKITAAARLRDPVSAALFAGRALSHPLTDLRADGTVQDGAFAPPSGFSLVEWMPTSFAAYQAEAKKRLEAVRKRKIPEARLAELRKRIKDDISACRNAASAVAKAEDASAACLFGDAACTPARAVSLSSAADRDRERRAAAQKSLALATSSGVLPASEVARINADKRSAGCTE